MKFRACIAVGLALAALGLAPACQKPLKRSSVVESREASTGGLKKVEIRNTHGKIDVISMRSLNPRFKVTATKWAKAPGADKSKSAVKQVKLKIHRSGQTAIIIIKHPEPASRTTYGADLKVILPAELDVDVDNRKGTVRILGMTGRVQVRVKQGSIEARGLDSHLRAHTKSGDIVASGQVRGFELSTDRGSVKVYVRGRDELTEASSVRTQKGNIRVSLSDQFNGKLTATAAGGKITIPFPGIRTKGKTRIGTLGKGGKLLALDARGGNILMLTRRYSKTRYMPQTRADGPRVLRHGPKGGGHGMHGHGGGGHRHPGMLRTPHPMTAPPMRQP